MYSMLLAGIFPAKQTQQKLVECSEVSPFIFWTHKNSLQTHNYVPAGFQQIKIAKSYRDVTLVKLFKKKKKKGQWQLVQWVANC